MQLKEVNNTAQRKAFLEVPLHIYRHDPNWIRPLDRDIENVFDPAANKYFDEGDAIRWVLYDQKGTAIGRVAAFFNRSAASKHEQPTGGMGFFECINDRKAAFKLFDACKNWLEWQGMEAMDGPVNFGERDRWWGLLVDGFHPPTYCMNYNPPYYQKLFESYGFNVYFKQYTFSRSLVGMQLPERYQEKAADIRQSPAYTIKHIEKNDLPRYASHFRYVYNAAWQQHPGFKPISEKQAMRLMQQLKPVMEAELIWFAYYHDEPVGFLIMLPEINQIIKHLNGKLNWLGKLKFAYYQWKRECNKAFGVAFGVHPEHQRKGIEAAIIDVFNDQVGARRYREVEMIWIGDFNPKMIHIVKSIGGEWVKTYHTYRYLFNRDKAFQRASAIG